MNAKKKLPPPKGAAAATEQAASLRTRFTADAPPAAEPVAPAASAKPKMVSHTRPPAAGMTRRTYYLSEDVARRLDATVDQIHVASRKLVPKHEILAALLQPGLNDAEQVRRQLVARAVAELQQAE